MLKEFEKERNKIAMFMQMNFKDWIITIVGLIIVFIFMVSVSWIGEKIDEETGTDALLFFINVGLVVTILIQKFVSKISKILKLKTL